MEFRNTLKQQTAIDITKYDVCLVFPRDESKEDDVCEFTMEGLNIVGQIKEMFKDDRDDNLYIYKGTSKNEIYVLIHITEERLREFSDNNDLCFLADPDTLQYRANEGWFTSVE